MVYNAKSGLKNAVLDSLHKIVSPSTYQCSLCVLTYSSFTEKAVWKEFKEKSKFKISFYHIDEFEAKFGKRNFIYPVALWYHNQIFETVISHETFKKIKSTKELTTYLEDTISLIIKSTTTP